MTIPEETSPKSVSGCEFGQKPGVRRYPPSSAGLPVQLKEKTILIEENFSRGVMNGSGMILFAIDALQHGRRAVVGQEGA